MSREMGEMASGVCFPVSCSPLPQPSPHHPALHTGAYEEQNLGVRAAEQLLCVLSFAVQGAPLLSGFRLEKPDREEEVAQRLPVAMSNGAAQAPLPLEMLPGCLSTCKAAR